MKNSSTPAHHVIHPQAGDHFDSVAARALRKLPTKFWELQFNGTHLADMRDEQSGKAIMRHLGELIKRIQDAPLPPTEFKNQQLAVPWSGFAEGAATKRFEFTQPPHKSATWVPKLNKYADCTTTTSQHVPVADCLPQMRFCDLTELRDIVLAEINRRAIDFPPTK